MIISKTYDRIRLPWQGRRRVNKRNTDDPSRVVLAGQEALSAAGGSSIKKFDSCIYQTLAKKDLITGSVAAKYNRQKADRLLFVKRKPLCGTLVPSDH